MPQAGAARLPLLELEVRSMLDTIRGAVAGALVLGGVAILVLTPLFLLLGPERVLVGNSLEFNTLWTGFALVVSLFAASFAGWLAHRVSGKLAAVVLLAVIVLVVGLADAAFHHWLMPHLSQTREGVSGFAMLLGLREPLWYDLSGPALMAIFIWVAGSSRHIETSSAAPVRRRRRSE
jgi:hypothetical protein